MPLSVLKPMKFGGDLSMISCLPGGNAGALTRMRISRENQDAIKSIGEQIAAGHVQVTKQNGATCRDCSALLNLVPKRGMLESH
jgi:hypothetical protein